MVTSVSARVLLRERSTQAARCPGGAAPLKLCVWASELNALVGLVPAWQSAEEAIGIVLLRHNEPLHSLEHERVKRTDAKRELQARVATCVVPDDELKGEVDIAIAVDHAIRRHEEAARCSFAASATRRHGAGTGTAQAVRESVRSGGA